MTARTCPACSTPLTESDAYCPRCGVAATNTQTQKRATLWLWILVGVVLVCPGAVVGIGLLASILIPRMIDEDFQLPEPAPSPEDDIDRIVSALHEHAIRNGGTYPDSLDALVTPDENGFRYLVAAQVPRDPWGREYLYEPPDADNPEPRVWSLGADGLPRSGDDLESGPPHGLGSAEPGSSGHEEQVRADFVRILAALGEYAIRNDDVYPDSLAALVVPDEDGLRYLAWEGLPTDPWGGEYHYAPPSSSNPDPRVWSDGPDGTPGGGDDIDSRTVRDGR